MQTLLFSRIIELHPWISFPCLVDGQELIATITHKEITDLQIMYHVRFSNGHRNAYAVGEAEVLNEFGRTRTPDAYEEAVFDDLCIVRHTEKGNWFIHLRVGEEGGDSYNVWIREKGGYYSVYYKGQYQFTLRKKKGWESGTRRERGYVVNGRLARLLADYLDQYAVQKMSELQRA